MYFNHFDTSLFHFFLPFFDKSQKYFFSWTSTNRNLRILNRKNAYFSVKKLCISNLNYLFPTRFVYNQLVFLLFQPEKLFILKSNRLFPFRFRKNAYRKLYIPNWNYSFRIWTGYFQLKLCVCDDTWITSINHFFFVSQKMNFLINYKNIFGPWKVPLFARFLKRHIQAAK